MKSLLSLTMCLWSQVIVLQATSSALADWPEFRGPTGNGVTSHSSLPIIWSQTNHVRWRTELPGEGWSSPVVVDDSVFLTAAVPLGRPDDHQGFDLKLFILDASSGEVSAEVFLFSEPPDAPSIHQKNSHASPTPVYDGEHLYVHFGHQGTACVTLTGEVVWKNDALAYQPVHGNGGSPAVVDNLLIFSRDGKNTTEVTALEKSTGKIAWQTERQVDVQRQFSFCTPLTIEVAGRRQLILPGSNVVQSLDPVTGSELWRLTYDGYSVIPRPIYENGLVFICTGYNRPSLLAIDPTGSGDITESHLRWQLDSNIPHTPSLLAYEGKIISISDKGVASAFEAMSGRKVWQQRIGGSFSASPLLAGQHVYLLSEEGICTILKLSDGPPVLVAENAMEERCLASMAVVEDDLLIRTADALYRIAAQ